MREPVDLDQLYDDATMRRLNRTPAARQLRPSPGPRSRLAAGVLVGALTLAMQEVFEPEATREPIVELAPDPGGEDGRVRLLFVPDDPRATVALVRT